MQQFQGKITPGCLWHLLQIPHSKQDAATYTKQIHYLPEFKSRPGLNALLFTVVDSLSQLIVLDTLVLKFPSNLK